MHTATFSAIHGSGRSRYRRSLIISLAPTHTAHTRATWIVCVGARSVLLLSSAPSCHFVASVAALAVAANRLAAAHSRRDSSSVPIISRHSDSSSSNDGEPVALDDAGHHRDHDVDHGLHARADDLQDLQDQERRPSADLPARCHARKLTHVVRLSRCASCPAWHPTDRLTRSLARSFMYAGSSTATSATTSSQPS